MPRIRGWVATVSGWGPTGSGLFKTGRRRWMTLSVICAGSVWPPRATAERPEQAGTVASIVRLRPPASVGLYVVFRALAEVVAFPHVAGEAVADEDRLLALRPARDEAGAGDDEGVAVHVVDVGVHRVLERDFPVAVPDDLADQDECVVEELLGHVLLDRRGLSIAHPHEHEPLERARRVDSGLRARLAAHSRERSLGQHHRVLARFVEHPAVVRTRHGAPVVAVALAQARAAVRAHVLDRDDVAGGASEQADVLAEQRDLHRLAPAHRAVLQGGIPVVAKTELGDQRPDVAAQLRNHAALEPVGPLLRWCHDGPSSARSRLNIAHLRSRPPPSPEGRESRGASAPPAQE